MFRGSGANLWWLPGRGSICAGLDGKLQVGSENVVLWGEGSKVKQGHVWEGQGEQQITWDGKERSIATAQFHPLGEEINPLLCP